MRKIFIYFVGIIALILFSPAILCRELYRALNYWRLDILVEWASLKNIANNPIPSNDSNVGKSDDK